MLKSLSNFIRACLLLPDVIVSFLLVSGLLLVSRLYRLFAKAPEKTTKRLLYLGGQASLEEYEKIDGFWAIYDQSLNGYFEHVYVGYFPTPKTQKVELKEGYTVYEMKPPLRGFFFFNYVLFLIWMTRIVFAEKITIIRAADPPYLIGPIGLLLRSITGRPCVVSQHADYDLDYQVRKSGTILGSRKVGIWVERFVFSHASLVLPIREHLKQYVLKRGAKPESIRVIHHGIHLDRFIAEKDSDFKEKHNLSGKRTVTFAGRLSKENLVEDIIYVAKMVTDIDKDVVFLLLGDGAERGNLQALTEKFNLTENVRFLESQKIEQVAYFKTNTDINLVPMGGFSLIESAASGNPVVAYDVEWHSELIKDKETGLLVKCRDTTAMAEAIIYLLRHPDDAERYAKKARQLVLERHSFEAHCRTLSGVYEEAMATIRQR